MPGSLATFDKAVDDPDMHMLVEIADWESADAREAVMKEGEAHRCICTDVRTLGRPAQGHAGRAAALTAGDRSLVPVRSTRA